MHKDQEPAQIQQSQKLTSISLRHPMLRMSRQQMKQIPPSPQLRYYKQLIIHAKHIIQPNHIIMPPQLPQHIHLLLQFGNVLGIIPQHDAFAREFLPLARFAAGVSLRLSAGGDANLPVGAFANDQIAVEEVGRPSLRGVQLRRGGLRRFGRGAGGSDVVGDPSHGGVVIVVLGGAIVRIAAGGAVVGAGAAPSGFFVGSGGGAGASVLLVVDVVVGRGVGGLLGGFAVVVVVHDLHVGLAVAACHGLH